MPTKKRKLETKISKAIKKSNMQDLPVIKIEEELLDVKKCGQPKVMNECGNE